MSELGILFVRMEDGMIKGFNKNMKMKFEDLTHKIIGCAMRVHSVLGSGFQEVIYQRAMTIEMGKQGLSFGREFEISSHV